MPNPRELVAYTARLFSESNNEAAHQLREYLGWGMTQTKQRLRGLSPDDIIKAITTGVENDTKPPTVDEHVTIAQLKRELADARRQSDELALTLGDARDWREGLLGIAGKPLAPRPITALVGENRAMTWVIVLSDNHLGKRITRDEVSGLQDYNVEIARNRVRRTFAKAVELIRLQGSPVSSLLVMCLGDNVNGALRLDDHQSNEIGPFAQSRAFAECVRDGIDMLLETFPCDIDVTFLPGNHGRTVANPPSVEIGENYDCIAGALVEWHYQGEPRVRVSNTGQADALIKIYGRGYLFTHGDRIGSGGGDGQIGALGPTKRGSLKIGQQQIEIGKYVEDLPDLAAVIMGHFHYHWTDYDVYVSGAGCGPDPWAFLKLRAKPKPPYQWLLGIEAEKGIIEEKRLFVGHPDEGPICSFRRAA